MNKFSIAIYSIAVAAASAASLPVGFQPNAGRFDPRVSFVAQGSEYGVSLEPGSVRFLLTSRNHKTGAVTMRFPGSHAPQALADGPPLGRANYFIGKDPARWARNLDQYPRVRYRNLYDGIDLALYENAGRLEHDFIVQPGADPSAVALSFSGRAPLRLTRDGALLIHTARGDLRFEPPALYQRIEGKRISVEGRYRLDSAARIVRFDVGPYDRRHELVIDPTVVFTASLTGSGVQTGLTVASDAQGNMYLAGVTTSMDLQLLNPTQKTFGGGIGDCFVAKWDATGNLIYATYLGGSSQEQPQKILVDAQGNAVVLGSTHSADFPSINPLPSGGYGPPGADPLSGKAITFIAKLDPTGSQLVYSTLLWSNNLQTYDSTGMALDSAGNAYITGFDVLQAAPAVSSPRMTATPGAYKSPALAIGSNHAWVAKLSPSGALMWDAVIGGSGQEQASGIGVDSSGAVYVAGFTGSKDFPVTSNNGVQQTLTSKMAGNAFLVVLNSSGSQLVYGTYFGGSGTDIASAVAVMPRVGVAIAGRTTSTDLPVTSNADQKDLGGKTIAGFYAVLNPPGLTIPVPQADVGLSPLGIGPAPGPIGLISYLNDPVVAIEVAILRAIVGDGLFFLEAPSGSSRLSWVFARNLDASASSKSFMITPPNGTFAATPALGNVAGLSLLTAGLYSAGTSVPTGREPHPADATIGAPASGLRISYLAVVNAASFATSSVSPGEIVTIFGDNLGPSSITTAQLDSTGQKLSTSVAGSQVFFDGDAAPIVYTSAGQMSVIVPYSAQGKTSVSVRAYNNGSLQRLGTLNVAASAPGIFTVNGKQAAALNQDNSYNSASNPAARGSTVVLFATGEGQTNPPGADGQLATSVYPKPVLPVSVTIGGQPANVAYYGAAPGLTAGLLQLNVVVPQNIPAGDAAVVLTVGDAGSQSGVTIAVN